MSLLLNLKSWNWDDQKPTDFTNWGVLSTDYYSRRYCTAVITNSSQPGKWDSVYCNETRSVICEKALGIHKLYDIFENNI